MSTPSAVPGATRPSDGSLSRALVSLFFSCMLHSPLRGDTAVTLAAVRKFPTDNGRVARRRTSSTFAAPRVSPTAACQGAMWNMLMQITASLNRPGRRKRRVDRRENIADAQCIAHLPHQMLARNEGRLVARTSRGAPLWHREMCRSNFPHHRTLRQIGRSGRN